MPSASTASEAGSHFFEYRAYKLHYEIVGSGPRIVVFMHGLLLDADINRGIADVLSRNDCTVVLFDLLGHGESDKPAHASEYRMDLFADQVVALLDHLEVAEAVVGGVSLGADVALIAAAKAPERINGLIIEMPVLEWAAPVAALTFVPLTLLLHYGRPLARWVAALARRIPRVSFGPVNSAVHAVSQPPELLAAVLHGILLGPVAPTHEERNAITAPALILGHRFDALHPLDDAVNLARQMPQARLVSASPIGLRLSPSSYSDEFATFLDEIWPLGSATSTSTTRSKQAASLPG